MGLLSFAGVCPISPILWGEIENISSMGVFPNGNFLQTDQISHFFSQTTSI
jgi:hypothetical protein